MYRSPELLGMARHAPSCMNPLCGKANRGGDIMPAHSNQLRDGKGRGLKAHDFRIAFLCQPCHYEIDQGSKMSRAERHELWEAAHRATIGWLFQTGRLQIAQVH